jgi:peptidyl-prolyl cis-trans isomerase A (cyclophilin A)
MKGFNTLMASLLVVIFSVFTAQAAKPKLPKNTQPGLYAIFTTARGTIIVQLEQEKAPMTVANFVGLAEGKFTVFDTIKFTKPFYDGLKFHRVIKDFMIQGGDPLGTGMGGPGYKFYDETSPELRHSGPGILSMANSGPATNGSQFFITHKETPWLDGKHTVFGHVIQGQNVVDSIQQDDVMISVKIVRVGKEFKKWNATQVFADHYATAKKAYDEKMAQLKIEEEKKRMERERLDAIEKDRIDRASKMSEAEYRDFLLAEIRKTYPNAQQTESGLVYIIENPGDQNKKPLKGDDVSTHYNGTFLNGQKFDSSYDRKQPLNFKHNVGQMIKGYDEAVSMLGQGGKGRFIIPYYNAYGKAGRAPQIPAYCDLVFEIELLDVKPAPTQTMAPATPPPAQQDNQKPAKPAGKH